MNRDRNIPVRAAVWCILLLLCGLLAACADPHSGCRTPSTSVHTESTDPGTQPPTESAPPKIEETKPVVPETQPPAPPLPLDDWRMILVNQTHPVDPEYVPATTRLPNGMLIDERCCEALTEMIRACSEAGNDPVICSAYRSLEKQTELFDMKVRKLKAKGLEHEAALEEAGTVVAVPGTSEHHLGLAVDIVDAGYQSLDSAQESTSTQRWLLEHCWEYGFILRYPNGKSDITGIIYEPWHYRYVGKEVALDVKRSGLCFEEYLAQFGAG